MNQRICSLALALQVIAMTCLCACQGPKDPLVVRTTSGLVKGCMEEEVFSFRAIPYMKADRFMPPQPADPWDTVRICDHYGPQSMQNVGNREMGEDRMSEANAFCMNIWSTDLKAQKPVMLWLHGGGFASGAGYASPQDTGAGFARKDVVLVSINHRLDILGYLDLSACGEKYKYSGNVGMLDVVAALEWIRDNIAAFGGDPGNVTIFGESGGGGKVGTLLCMPPAQGLFHKAIIQSGTIININSKEMSQKLGLAVLTELGLTPEQADRLADVPYKELYRAGQQALAHSVGTRTPGTPMMWGFGPTPDGETLLQQPFSPGFASISSDIPILIGTTFNELQRSSYGQPLTADEAKEILKGTFAEETDAYIEAFAQAYPDYTPQDLLSIDRMFRPKTVITADAASAQKTAPVYTYMFTWRAPEGNAGSAHGYELPFCFNTLPFASRMLPNPTAEDLELADLMCGAWVNFATTGDPNTEGLPQWQPYTADNGEIMIFDLRREVRHNYDRTLQEIINRHCFPFPQLAM